MRVHMFEPALPFGDVAGRLIDMNLLTKSAYDALM